MISFLLASIALCMLALAATAARLRRAAPVGAPLVAVVCVGLAYDCAAIAVGPVLGFGSALHAVNQPRYWIHAVLTPLMILAVMDLAARAGVVSLARRPVRIGLGALTAVLVALGVASDVVALRLAPETYADTLRYVNDAAEGPPVPAIVTILVLIGIGAALWRRAGVPWLCLGSVAMFVAAAAGFAHFWIGNTGELLLQAGIVATLAAVAARTSPAHASAPTPQPQPTPETA
ncbi:hypothetical protein [Catellatospora sp. NPDC049609]|uniref:hypothetical protein n=1 Tax=Catellatospora sp. NPDC049609 TaxID=3155505 RepID=UPI00341720FF